MSAFGPDGRQRFDLAHIPVPGSKRGGWPIGADIDSDGTFAFAYYTGGEKTGVALLDSTGKTIRLIETQPYQPAPVCFGPDHSIWMYREPGDDAESAELPVFRHYSREGVQLGSFVPRSEIVTWLGAEGAIGALAPNVGFWFMRVSKDRIGAFFHAGFANKVWVELDFNGKLMGHWSLPGTLEDDNSIGAFTADGKLYGNNWVNGKRVWASIFDKNTGTWQRIPSLPNWLIGAQDDQLVFKQFDQLVWVPQSEVSLATNTLATDTLAPN